MRARGTSGYIPRGVSRHKRPRYSWSKLEKKVHTLAFTIQPVQGTIPELLNGTVAGTGVTQRVGDTIVVRKIMIRCCIVATGTSVNACYRFILLWDKQANKALPSLSDIFTGTAPHSPLDFFDLEGRKRFITVWNSHIFAVGANTNDNDNRVYEFNCDCAAETVYSGPTGDISVLTTGALLLITISDKIGVTQVATATIQTRIRFTDGSYGGKPKFFNKTTSGHLQGN